MKTLTFETLLYQQANNQTNVHVVLVRVILRKLHLTVFLLEFRKTQPLSPNRAPCHYHSPFELSPDLPLEKMS